MAISKNISFYPQLNDELFDCIYDTKNSNLSFSYTVNDEVKSIEYIDNNDNISFDNSTDWNCDDYDLDVVINIKLKNLSKLFGANGIAPSNSKIGLCVEWYSPQAKIRKVIKAQDLISISDSDKSFTFEITLPRQTFNSSLSLNVLLYLAKQDGDLSKDESLLNNNTGVLIGTVIKKVIFMVGNGSQFPIKVISIPNSNLLWKLELSLDEPGSRQISDGISLILNSAHKDYKYIDPNSNYYCERLADEIVTNAIVIFLTELSKSSEFDLDGNYEEGTLLSYAKYCKERLDIDFDGLISISNSMHEFSERGE